MNREILMALLGTLLALGLGYLFLHSNPGALGNPEALGPRIGREASSEETRPIAQDRTQATIKQSSIDSAGMSLTPLEAAEAEWAQAVISHQEAEHALEESARALDDVEREIDAVDRFVEDLEERGEDPADFAEEGMAKLRPAIERFEARLEIVERNEQLEAEARSRLDAADAELGRQREISP